MLGIFHRLRGDLLINGFWYTKKDVQRLFPLITANAIKLEKARDEAVHRAFLLAVENKELKDAAARSANS